jgi:hypothetical protein
VEVVRTPETCMRFKVQGSGFTVQGLGRRVKGIGWRV